ncbi:MAG: glycogen synthase GlgA [Clostridia bacterium]
MKVLFAASECVPFIKTGGLADVVGSLPIALAERGMDVRVILPKYRIIDGYWKSRMEHVCSFEVLFGWAKVYCGVFKTEDQGVTYYFIDNEDFFSTDQIYGDGPAEGYRFAFFCRAVLEALPRIGFFPDILHCNDWQAGLIAPLLRTQYSGNENYHRIRTVFSIHNLKYQGIFSWKEMAGRLGLDERYNNPDYLEFYGCMNCLKGGIVFSDYVLTVSRTYAEEIKTSYYGENLDGLLRARSITVSGILNGIDYTVFNPETDRFLTAHYTKDDLSGKAENKARLQEECGLEVRPEVPIIGVIARLTPQKGLDLIERVLDDILRLDVQVVVLGKGDKRFVDMLNWANWRYPRRMHARIALDEGLAHRVYAGSDLFLMPSQFEPCGLSQMIALHYGSVPIVRETGGLKDTVIPYNLFTDEGNGFSFTNYNAHEMLFTIERAVRYYAEDKPMWNRLVQRGMKADFSWNSSAKEYRALYEKLMSKLDLPSRTMPEKQEIAETMLESEKNSQPAEPIRQAQQETQTKTVKPNKPSSNATQVAKAPKSAANQSDVKPKKPAPKKSAKATTGETVQPKKK